MKTFGNKSLSSYLYWIAISCFALCIIGFVLIMSFPIRDSFVGGHSLSAFFVFAPLAVFFYFLIKIFKDFTSPKLFTKKTIKHLRYFAFVNFCMPIVALIFVWVLLTSNTIIVDGIQGGIGLDNIYLNIEHTLPHITIGVFALLLVAILKQGFRLQSENDLTI